MKKLLLTGATLLALQSGNIQAAPSGSQQTQEATKNRITSLCNDQGIRSYLADPDSICEVSLDGGKNWTLLTAAIITLLGAIGTGGYLVRKKIIRKNTDDELSDEDWIIDHLPGFEGDHTIGHPETNESDTHEMIDRVMILAGIIPQSIRDILPGLDPRATLEDLGFRHISPTYTIYPNYFTNHTDKITLNRAYEVKNGREIIQKEYIKNINNFLKNNTNELNIEWHPLHEDQIFTSVWLGSEIYTINIQGDGEFYYLTNAMGGSINKDAEIIEGNMIPMDFETVRKVISKLIHNPQDDIPTLDEIIPIETIDTAADAVDTSNTTNNAIEELQKTAESDLNSLIVDMTKSKDAILKELTGKLELHNLSDPVADFDILAIIPQNEFGEIGARFYQKILIADNEIQRIQQQIELASVNHQADPNNALIEQASQESFQSCIDTMKILSQEIIEDRNIFLLGIENETKKMEIIPIVSNINNELLSDSIDFDLSDPFPIADNGETDQGGNEGITEPTIDNTSGREILSPELIQSIQEKANARVEAENELNVRAIRLDKRNDGNQTKKSKLHLLAKTPEQLEQEWMAICKRITEIFKSMELFQDNAPDIIYRENRDEYSEEYIGSYFGKKKYIIEAYQHKNDLNAKFTLVLPDQESVQFFKPTEFFEHMIEVSKKKYYTIIANIQK